MNNFFPDRHALRTLGAIGIMAVLGFLVVFMNVPWEWNMFMDDVHYNTWMPHVLDLAEVIRNEISSYWRLGRFYPVKYVANLLKWKYLPNDPYVFRYFNLSVFFLSIGLAAIGAIRASGARFAASSLAVFVFLFGSAFLHKPLLEIISLNPLGETWVCLFFSLGVFCLFSRHWSTRFLLARIFFVLVALSKEPAALVFFASSMRYLLLAWRRPEERKAMAGQVLVDLMFFVFFLSLAFYVMSQGSFTKGAYFSATPWARYALDFIYKLVRYGLWTSPFLVFFACCWRQLGKAAKKEEADFLSAIVFFSVYGLSYLVFMSTQGRVAYQEIPASIAIFCLFSVLMAWLLRSERGAAVLDKYGIVLLALFALSYFISVSRWERFVRGIVEPKRAVTNLLATGEEMTLLVPVGEVQGHIEIMIKQANPRAKVFGIDRDLPARAKEFRGTVYALEFPYYMGDLGVLLSETKTLAGGWVTVADGYSYRIYRGAKQFP